MSNQAISIIQDLESKKTRLRKQTKNSKINAEISAYSSVINILKNISTRPSNRNIKSKLHIVNNTIENISQNLTGLSKSSTIKDALKAQLKIWRNARNRIEKIQPEVVDVSHNHSSDSKIEFDDFKYA